MPPATYLRRWGKYLKAIKMPIERIKGFFIFLLIGAIIIYIIYRTSNKFSKKDIPFKASMEIDLVIIFITLALIVILFCMKN